MSALLSLPLQAAELATRPARWIVGQVLERVRGEDDAPPPSPPAEPKLAVRPGAAKPKAAAKQKPAAEAKPKPNPKPAAKPAANGRKPRSEPTRGQVARLREQQREAEQNAGGPGPGATIEVAEPWDGYDGMTEDDVLERLIGAEPAVRAIVRLYESEHGGRRQILIATEEPVVEP